jgi:hypothetical protein
MNIRLTIAGRQYDAAAVVPDVLALDDEATLVEALRQVAALMPDGRLPPSCLVAVNGVHLGTVGRLTDSPLRHNDELLLLMPVAGG